MNNSISLKKKYYQLSKEEFEDYLETLKKDPSCKEFFTKETQSYFLVADKDIKDLLFALRSNQVQIDKTFLSKSPFVQNEITLKCLIDEIQATNRTENIHSTRNDIYSLMNHISTIRNTKIASSIRAYDLLLNGTAPEDLYDIREIYDCLMENSFENPLDKPDGRLFRKNIVRVTNGLNTVHSGFYPEDKIIEAMDGAMTIYQDTSWNIYLRIIIYHFLFETIHPFYDGNGRLGRLLMSMKLYEEEKTIFSFTIAAAIYKQRSAYYKSLEAGRQRHEFGCLNDYVMRFGKILLDGQNDLIGMLKESDSKYEYFKDQYANLDLTKTEQLIFDLLLKAGCYGLFGLNNQMIMDELQVSRRTVVSSISHFRNLDLLEDTRFSRTTYHKIRTER